MHLKRWITGLIALPILVLLVYLGGVAFTSLVSVAAVFSLWEYYRIAFSDRRASARSGIIALWGYFLSLGLVWAAHFSGPRIVVGLIALNVILVGLLAVLRYKNDPAVLEVAARQIQGIVYIPLLLSFLIVIRSGPAGMIWIFFLLAVVFGGDTSALYVGTYFGKHKLYPAVSPGKTIEGSIGGLCANLVVGAIIKHYFMPQLPWHFTIVFLMAVGVAGQVGDLFESALKRSCRIKDSGGILPGHGGFLDRIDALLFAAPVAYFFQLFVF